MPQHADFHNAHRLQHTYASSIPTSLEDNRSFASHSGGMRPPQQFHLPRPIEVDFRNYPHSSPSSSAVWDGTLPNYGFTDNTTTFFRSNQDPTDTPARSGTQDPLLNWYTNNDGPWIPRGTVPDIPMDHNQSRGQPPGFRSTSCTTPIGLNHPREANSSETGGTPFVYLSSDSGYGTRRSFENASVFSSELPDRNQDCSSLTGQANDNNQSFSPLKVSVQPPESELSESWAGSQPPSVVNQSQTEHLQCSTCKRDVKTKSELKKHDLRHKKPFHCSHPGCGRKEGFSTTNDLERHRRSKHPSDSPRASSKLYRCVYPQCKSQNKVWPRLDNFRCHIKRVHSLEADALEELVRRSEHHERSRSSGRTNQNYAQDSRFQERDTQQREYLPDLTIIHQAQYRSEDTDDSLPEELDRPRTSKSSGMLRSPDHVNFHSGVFRPVLGTFSEQSSRHDRMEIDPNLSNTEVNNEAMSAKQRSSPRTDYERQDYRNTSGFHSDIGQVTMPRKPATDLASTEVLTFALAHTNIAEPANCKEILDSRMNGASNTTLLERPPALAQPQDVPLEDQNMRTPPDPEEVARAMKTLETLGYRIQKYPVSEESKDPHSKKYPTPEPSEAEPSAPHPGVKSEQLVCPVCLKYTAKPCQLKKHMKRHERPYGCTFMNCGKKFGSKNDWKRHENSQHFQLETWRCDEDKASPAPTSPCAKVCYRKESFKDHLIKEHKISDLSEVKEKLETCRIGRNCQSRFWCGFCKALKDLRRRGVEAWTERFNHIDDHFSGRHGWRKQGIKEWVPVDGEERYEEQQRQKIPEIVVLDDDASDAVEASSRRNEVGRNPNISGNGNVTFNPMEWNAEGRRKRRGNDECESGRPVKSARRSRPEERIICCQCESPHNPAVVVGCTVCEDNHRFCDSCEYVEADPCPRGSDG